MTLSEKARRNRDAALSYVRVHRHTLIRLTQYRLKGPIRRPVPAIGFTTSRGRVEEGHAA